MENYQVTLDYIDKLHISVLSTGKSINRSLLLILLLSLFLITWAFEVAALTEEISISGIKIGVASWLIPFFGSWLLSMAFMYLHGLTMHEARSRDNIIRLYKELGYKDKSLDDFDCNPLEHPNIVTVAFSRNLMGNEWPAKLIFPMAIMLISFGLFVLPFIAQGIVCYKLINLFGWKWWICSSYIFIFVLMTCYLVLVLKKH